MTPNPSGAARAPQSLTEHEAVLQVIEGAFDEISRICQERWNGKEGWRTSIPARPGYDSDLILADALVLARSRLGALVQAVEDQQRQLEIVEQDYENCCRARKEAETLVAQLRADGQRLRTALKPFEPAKVAPHLDAADADAAVDWVCTIADLRRVRDALSSGLPSGDAP